jgi:sugar/nucleoside kinase (ribokinase family)
MIYDIMPICKKHTLVCVGDVVMDAFIALEKARVHNHPDREHREICMPFADKIPYTSLQVMPAVGNASNIAVGASRLGIDTAILTAVGKDYYGHQILDWYKKERVGAELVKVNKGKPTNYHFVLNYGPERTILIKHEDYIYDDPARIGGAPWIYFSSIGEHTLAFHEKLAKYLVVHPETKMAFNPGTFQLKFGPKKLKEIYRHTYVLFVNREEAELILGAKRDDIKKLLSGLRKLGPKIVVITDGPLGAYASDDDSCYFMPPYPDPKPPISRTGAGDAFSAGFFSALICGMSVPEALRWAPIESMHVVQYFGAQTGLLTKPELLKILKKAPKSYQPKFL